MSLIPFPTSLALKVSPYLTTSLREVGHHALTGLQDAHRRGIALAKTEILPRAKAAGGEARTRLLGIHRFGVITARAGGLIWQTSEARARLVSLWQSDAALAVRRYSGHGLRHIRAAWARADGFEIEAICGMAMLLIALVILVRAF